MMELAWGRWMTRIGLGILAALAAFGAVLCFRNPDRALLLAWVIVAPLVQNWHPPAVANGQITTEDWGHWDAASRKLTAVLERKFPTGTNETGLKSTLLGQGFKPPPSPPPDCLPRGQPAPVGRAYTPCYETSNILQYDWGHFPCRETITVWWTTGDNGEVTYINGSYHGACL
jgi:hypothetical protein